VKYTSIERIWTKYANKYQALSVCSLLARRDIEAAVRGESQLKGNVFEHALDLLISTDVKFEKLTEAEVEALTREGFGEAHTRTWREPSAFGR
jgi:hypothetical protein